MNPYAVLNLSSILPLSLVWKQPRFSEDYFELVDESAGDAKYASLSWPKWLSDQAIARSAAGTWYFDRVGWTRRTIKATQLVKQRVSSNAEDHPTVKQIASFEVGFFWEGDLILSNGEVFHWYRTKAFRNLWAMTQVIPSEDSNLGAEMIKREGEAKIQKKRRGFHFGKRKKPARREKLVYEIEFGMDWFKQKAWIRLPARQAVHHHELIFLLCSGMYLGYCYNQDSASAVAVSSVAAIT